MVALSCLEELAKETHILAHRVRECVRQWQHHIYTRGEMSVQTEMIKTLYVRVVTIPWIVAYHAQMAWMVCSQSIRSLLLNEKAIYASHDTLMPSSCSCSCSCSKGWTLSITIECVVTEKLFSIKVWT